MRKLTRTLRVTKITVMPLLLVSLTSPANAQVFLPISQQMLSAISMTVSSASFCVEYIHDENGNRIAVASSSVATGAVWGSSRFGCFTWEQ